MPLANQRGSKHMWVYPTLGDALLIAPSRSCDWNAGRFDKSSELARHLVVCHVQADKLGRTGEVWRFSSRRGRSTPLLLAGYQPCADVDFWVVSRTLPVPKNVCRKTAGAPLKSDYQTCSHACGMSLSCLAAALQCCDDG